MAVSQLTFLAPQPGSSYQTRSGTFTADGNGFIGNVPIAGSAVADLVASGCIPCAANPASNFRNLLDGGDFTVNPWQRDIAAYATSHVLTTAINGATVTAANYFPDRWFAAGSGASSIYMSNIADTTVAGFNASCFVGRTSGQTQTVNVLFGQVLEPFDVIKCQGQQVTLSWWSRSGALYSGGGMLAQIIAGNAAVANWATDATATKLVAGTWAGQSVVATNNPANTIGSAPTPPVNMVRQSITGVVPYGTTELGVLFQWTPTGTAGATDGIFFGGLQLEIGGQSPFEHRDVQVETEICQRYAWIIPEPATGVVVGAGEMSAATTAIIYMAAPVQFAKAPTVSVVAGTFHVVTAAVAAAGTIAAGSTHTVNAISITATGCTSTTAGFGCLLQGGSGSGAIQASADY